MLPPARAAAQAAAPPQPAPADTTLYKPKTAEAAEKKAKKPAKQVTVWRDETAMKKYRGSGAHQVAMRLLSEMCSEAAYVRWGQETPTLPTWEEAHQRILHEGKLSKVKRPSALQAAGKTAPDMMMPGFVPPLPPV